jgi:protein-tyrosine phosphatase
VLQVQAWIDAALGSGGAVLVHCHEGKSRSVALLLAYLMISKGHTLATALAHIRFEGLVESWQSSRYQSMWLGYSRLWTRAHALPA